jgi:hypothetical protein
MCTLNRSLGRPVLSPLQQRTILIRTLASEVQELDRPRQQLISMFHLLPSLFHEATGPPAPAS